MDQSAYLARVSTENISGMNNCSIAPVRVTPRQSSTSTGIKDRRSRRHDFQPGKLERAVERRLHRHFRQPATFDLAPLRTTASGSLLTTRPSVDDWSIPRHAGKTADVSLTQGQSVQVVIEYYQHDGESELHFFVTQATPIHSAFLTRLTPMNFYALSAGAPDAERAARVLTVLTDPTKFWGKYLLPTRLTTTPTITSGNTGAEMFGARPIILPGSASRSSRPPNGSQRICGSPAWNSLSGEWLAKGSLRRELFEPDGTQNLDPHYNQGRAPEPDRFGKHH